MFKQNSLKKSIKNYSLFLLVFMFITFSTSCVTNSNDFTQVLLNNNYKKVPLIKNKVGHLVLEAKLNGVSGFFILDTGASATIIDSKNTKELNLKLNTEDADFTGGGAGGNGLEVIPSSGNTLEFYNLKLEDFTVGVMNLEHVITAYKQRGIEEKIFGVIGADILKPHNAIIDYANLILWLN